MFWGYHHLRKHPYGNTSPLNLKWCCEGYVWRVFLRYPYAATSVCYSPQMYQGHILCTSTMNEIPITVHQITVFCISNFEGIVYICFHFLNLNMLQVLLLNLPESTNIRMEICVKPGRSETCLPWHLGFWLWFRLGLGYLQQPKSCRISNFGEYGCFRK